MRQLGLKFWHRRRNLNRRLICFLPLSPVCLSPSRSDQFCNATLHLGVDSELRCTACRASCDSKYSRSFLRHPCSKCKWNVPRISLDCRQSCFMSSGSKKANLQLKLGKMWTSSYMLKGLGPWGWFFRRVHTMIKRQQFDQHQQLVAARSRSALKLQLDASIDDVQREGGAVKNATHLRTVLFVNKI